MTDQPQDLRVENSLLRASLWITARSLKNYLDCPHHRTDKEGMLRVTVAEGVRDKATDALEQAQARLRFPDQGRGRG